MPRIICLFLFFVFLPFRTTNACGPGDPGFQGYSFINPKIIAKEDPYAPFFLSWGDLYQHFKDIEIVRYNENLHEWQSRVCESAPIKDIARVVYGSSIEELELLRTAARSKNIPIEPRLRANKFAQYLDNLECYETIDYLLFAKKCEPHVTKGDAWNEETKDYAAMNDLISEGRKLFRRVNSQYIKQRYAYQVIRLAHYRKEYKRTLDLYENMVPKVDPVLFDGKRSIIYWWTLGHKAGALQSLGETAKADYLFSVIFDKCPGRRDMAFQSFKIKSDEEWNEVMLLCQNDHERSMLYALRGHPEDAHAVEEMEAIYNLDPKNPHLERLLVREIQKLEKDLLGTSFNNNRQQNKRRYKIPRKDAGNYVIELQEFSRKMRLEKKVIKPELWYLAEGYLELLAGDNYAAAKTFVEIEAEGIIEEETLKEQLHAFKLALDINSFEKLTDAAEKEAYEILTDHELYDDYKDFPDFLRDKMTKLYDKANRPGKAFRCQHQLGELRANPQPKIIDDLMKVCLKKVPTSFERLLVQNEDNILITSDLWDMRATMSMQEYQIDEALNFFKKIPYTEWNDFGIFDPFRATIRDCIECPHSKDTIDLYNKGEFMQEILELEIKAKAEPNTAPKCYFDIGVGLYNTTYFGHSWDAMDHFRSGSIRFGRGIEDNVFPIYGYEKGRFPFGNKEHINTRMALYFFKRAIILSSDPELTAKAAFMAAKCEMAEYYISKDYRQPCRNCIPNVPEQYRAHFKMLKEDLYETNFYTRMIEECSYFRAYAK